jgi:hypothetical protein
VQPASFARLLLRVSARGEIPCSDLLSCVETNEFLCWLAALVSFHRKFALSLPRSRIAFGDCFGREQAQPSSGDQPRAALVSEIRPCPIEEHGEPVAESDQEDDVNHQPGHPRHKTAQMQFADLGDGGLRPIVAMLPLIA